MFGSYTSDEMSAGIMHSEWLIVSNAIYARGGQNTVEG